MKNNKELYLFPAKYVLAFFTIASLVFAGCNSANEDLAKKESIKAKKEVIESEEEAPEKETRDLSTKEATGNEIDKNKEINTGKENLSPTLDIAAGNENFNEYLPIFMFHYIRDYPADSPDQLGYRLSFSPEKFEQFLKFFKENNIQTLTFWDLKDILEGKKKLPEKSVMLTFDDGHLDHYQNAFRILEKYDMKGVFFIIANRPGQDGNYADWEQIKEMSDRGNEIASHTVSHLDLRTLSKEEIKVELEKSKEILEEKTGKPVISFCYPAGKYDGQIISLVQENYLFARTTKAGKHFSVSERYEIPTVRMFPDTSVSSLRIWFKVN